jgi:glutaminyl-tRNA synthetase
MKPAKPKGPPRPTVQDPQAMFKEGFLAEVYQENPISSNGIKEVKTRFPPEPNGHLHIGHCKAIAINFGFARYHGGQCYLRFDDTNPEAEKDIFYKSIEESVRWLGYNPSQITYSSDHFDRLYELAEFLIKEDGAYVCYCSSKSSKNWSSTRSQSSDHW